jgi:porphobilinogen deaminase
MRTKCMNIFGGIEPNVATSGDRNFDLPIEDIGYVGYFQSDVYDSLIQAIEKHLKDKGSEG